MGFETEDITAVYMFHYTPDAIIVHADSPYQTLDDLVADAKENPGRVTFSGSGKGTANHLAQVRFDEMADINTTYVSFQGTGAAVTALLGQQVAAEWGYTTVGAAQGDQVRMLAVAMEERHPALPNSASEETRRAVSDAIGAINQDEEFRQKMLDGGFALADIAYGGEMDGFLADLSETYLKAARSAGIIE